MTEQEFENCKQALLVAAKMICDQPLEQFTDVAWNRWYGVGSPRVREFWRLAHIGMQCISLKKLIDSFGKPPQP